MGGSGTQGWGFKKRRLAATVLGLCSVAVCPAYCFIPGISSGLPRPHRPARPRLAASRAAVDEPQDLLSGAAGAVTPKSVIVIGSGAVGCLYGGRLKEAGHDVCFMLRRELDAARQKGLRITSPDGDMFFPREELQVVGTAREYEEMRRGRPADWVIFTLKSTSFDEIPRLLGRHVVGPHTRVLVIMNGLGLESDLSRWVDKRQIFGGMAFVCANRGPTGSAEVAHLKYGKLVVGHALDEPGELEEARRLWGGSKVEVEYAQSLLKARWSKLVWNICFNGLGVLLGGIGTDKIVGTPELRQLASRVMQDTIRAANADLDAHRGPRDSPERVADGDESAITMAFHDLMLDLTDRMGVYYSSTVLDYLAGQPMETEYIFNRPLRRARELGVHVPHMESVCLAVEGLRKVKGV